MECWYKDCKHSSTKNECSFRVMPSDHCQAKIWMRYASIAYLPKSRTPVLCSCHFNETNDNPIPYFEGERKQCKDELQSTLKHEILNEEGSNQCNNIEKNANECFKDEGSLLRVRDSSEIFLKGDINKKNKLEEVIKPRGFERGLELEKIVGVTNCKNELMFLLKWHDCLEYDLVKASEVNEKCPDIVIEYYESRCPINQKCENNERSTSKYESELIDYPAPIRDKINESEATEPKISSTDADIGTDAVQGTTEDLPFLETPDKTADADNDVVNAAFSINVDDTNSVQVSYSLPLIENQPGEELMETQISDDQGSLDTSGCHMPDLQDVEMQ